MENFIDVKKLATDCMEQIQEAFQSLNRLNIMVVGKTGVGKSTLINSVFRKSIAETGIGSKSTTYIHEHMLPDFPLHIVDTVGLELDDKARKDAIDQIQSEISTREITHDFSQLIHCIWYCINAGSDRLEESEEAFIKSIASFTQEREIPVLIVITKAVSNNLKEFIRYIENRNLGVQHIVPVLAKDFELYNGVILSSYGLDILVSSTISSLHASLRDTFISVQKASLKEKIDRARSVIDKFCIVVFGEGFSPVPMSDIALWIPTETLMIVG